MFHGAFTSLGVC